MMVTDVIDSYLTHQRSLGMRFESAGELLHRFGRAMGERPIQEVTAGAVLDFLNGNGALTATWMLKHRVLILNPAVDFEWRPGFAAVHNHCE
jgi:integrase/recombinase XerD